ncbi:MAG: isoprenylcysteine carboxylmethyltransferase family protein [Gammaproteobacteria bacterium]|jgi:protein-S-isoprenylcysteine O-methyltransferase Ste14
MRPRVFPPVIALFTAALMWLLDTYMPLLHLLDEPWNMAGLLLIAAALVIDGWSLSLFLMHRTTIHPLKPEMASALVTRGMYRFTRNPMYLGLLLLLTGLAIYMGSLTPLMMLPLFVMVMNSQQILHEERVLEEKFGEEYRAYKERVRRWL